MGFNAVLATRTYLMPFNLSVQILPIYHGRGQNSKYRDNSTRHANSSGCIVIFDLCQYWFAGIKLSPRLLPPLLMLTLEANVYGDLNINRSPLWLKPSQWPDPKYPIAPSHFKLHICQLERRILLYFPWFLSWNEHFPDGLPTFEGIIWTMEDVHKFGLCK